METQPLRPSADLSEVLDGGRTNKQESADAHVDVSTQHDSTGEPLAVPSEHVDTTPVVDMTDDLPEELTTSVPANVSSDKGKWVLVEEDLDLDSISEEEVDIDAMTEEDRLEQVRLYHDYENQMKNQAFIAQLDGQFTTTLTPERQRQLDELAAGFIDEQWVAYTMRVASNSTFAESVLGAEFHSVNYPAHMVALGKRNKQMAAA